MGQITVGQITVGQITVGQVTVGQITVGQMTVGQITVGTETPKKPKSSQHRAAEKLTKGLLRRAPWTRSSGCLFWHKKSQNHNISLGFPLIFSTRNGQDLLVKPMF